MFLAELLWNGTLDIKEVCLSVWKSLITHFWQYRSCLYRSFLPYHHSQRSENQKTLPASFRTWHRRSLIISLVSQLYISRLYSILTSFKGQTVRGLVVYHCSEREVRGANTTSRYPSMVVYISIDLNDMYSVLQETKMAHYLMNCWWRSYMLQVCFRLYHWQPENCTSFTCQTFCSASDL